MKKKILVILGHPYNKSFCNELAESYASEAEKAGADVRIIKLGNLKFNPNLRWGYEKIQKLEPDLAKAQNMIKWADHLVFVYPVWWSTMPALLKGFIDRIFLPGFSFKFRKGSSIRWDRLLKGKTGHIIITMGAPLLFYRISGSPGIKQMKKGILGFCGVNPVRTTAFGSIKSADKQKREKWIDSVRKLGSRMK